MPANGGSGWTEIANEKKNKAAGKQLVQFDVRRVSMVTSEKAGTLYVLIDCDRSLDRWGGAGRGRRQPGGEPRVG